MATATRTRVKRTEFLNRTGGYLGVIKIDRKGDDTSVPVKPGERVFLTDEEIELSEQSHARAENSPFTPRKITIYDPHTLEEVESFVACPLERVVKGAK